MNAPSKTCLLWFLKAPVKGLVKSRLAVSVGEEHALELYRCFLTDLLEDIKTLSLPIKVFYTPKEEQTVLTNLLGDQFTYIPQQGKDLGERLNNAFQETFLEGFENIFVIGGDSPDLPSETYQQTQKLLETNDIVIGPANDGGYYLLGIRQKAFHASLFEEIQWGTKTVFDETLSQCKKRGITPYLLPVRQDIDTIDDLKELVKQNQTSGFASSHTMKYAKELLRE